jgi:hypothetical protein
MYMNIWKYKVSACIYIFFKARTTSPDVLTQPYVINRLFKRTTSWSEIWMLPRVAEWCHGSTAFMTCPCSADLYRPWNSIFLLQYKKKKTVCQTDSSSHPHRPGPLLHLTTADVCSSWYQCRCCSASASTWHQRHVKMGSIIRPYHLIILEGSMPFPAGSFCAPTSGQPDRRKRRVSPIKIFLSMLAH